MSDQDMTDMDRDAVLAGERALGLLSPEEAAAFDARLKSEPELRALYAKWTEDFAAMAEDIEPVTPPASVKRNIDARLFPEESKPIANRLGLGWLAGTLAAVAAVVLIYAGVFDSTPDTPTNPTYQAELAADDGSLIVAAAYDADSSTLFMDRQAGNAAPGRSLELWLIVGENAPVSLGILSENKETALVIEPALRPGLDGGVLAITDEPEGGSPTGSATGPIVAVGPVIKI